jgi:hypothetical protein
MNELRRCVECGRQIRRIKGGWSHVSDLRHVARPFEGRYYPPLEPPSPGWVRWLLRRLTA